MGLFANDLKNVEFIVFIHLLAVFMAVDFGVLNTTFFDSSLDLFLGFLWFTWIISPIFAVEFLQETFC